MAKRKSMLSIDFSNFSDYAEKLDKLGADLKTIFSEAMEQAAETVEWDTKDAMNSNNLPAHGQYSTGDTKDSIVSDAKVKWNGSIGEIGLGFDKTKPGAGGFLITGTPRMRPNYALQEIFGRKKYEITIIKQIKESLQDELDRRLGGG